MRTESGACPIYQKPTYERGTIANARSPIVHDLNPPMIRNLYKKKAFISVFDPLDTRAMPHGCKTLINFLYEPQPRLLQDRLDR